MYRSPYTRPRAALSMRLAGATFFGVLAGAFLYVGSLPSGWFLSTAFYFIGACCAGLTVQAAFDL